MPFESRAQQRLFFAKNPKKAREWAKETPNMSDLPEKKHPQQNPNRDPANTKIASDGMFFQKRAQIRGGRFFRDLSGREDGTFHQKTAMISKDPGEAAGDAANVSPNAMGAPPDGGEEAGGGMYGTGAGRKKSGAAMLREKLDKTAAASPSDWDADSGLPSGFHRPTEDQPEALEAGGVRFQSSEAAAPNFGAPNQRHGVVEGGSVRTSALTPSQMGKHAAPRFLGTIYGDEKIAAVGDYAARVGDYASQRGEEAKKSLATFGRGVANKSDELVKGITQSPTSTAIAALVLGKMGLGAMKGVGRGAARLVGRRRPAPKAPGQVLGGLRKLITGR